MATIVLDLIGLKCPLPAMRTRKALAVLKAGDCLDVRCNDPLAAIDIPHLVDQTGHRLLQTARDGRDLIFLIEKSAI